MLKDRKKKPVVGRRIALGQAGKGKGSHPTELEYFQITSSGMNRDGQFDVIRSDQDALEEYCQSKSPRKVPFTVSSDVVEDFLNMRYEVRIKNREGKLRVFCSGDGDMATRLTKSGEIRIPCRASPDHPKRLPVDLKPLLASPSTDDPTSCANQCPFAQNPTTGDMAKLPKCKPRTDMLVTSGINPNLGTFDRFRSSGHLTADGIQNSLEEIQKLTGGFLAGVPLRLAMRRVKMERPGGGVAVHSVAHVELDVTPQEARALVATRAKEEHEWKLQRREARALLSAAEDLEDQEREFPSAVVVDESPSGSMPAVDADFEEVEKGQQTLIYVEASNKDPTGGDR